MPFAKRDPEAAVSAIPAPTPDTSAGVDKPKRVGLLQGMFHKPKPGVESIPDAKENKEDPVVAAPAPDTSARAEKPKRVGLLQGIFHKPEPGVESIPHAKENKETGEAGPVATNPATVTPEENIPPPKDPAPPPPKPDQAKIETKAETKVNENLPPAKAGKKTLFANLFKRGPRADDAKPAPAARKKPGFHWPWSKAGAEELDAAAVVADTPAPKPENIPYGLPATPPLEIKPREPETGLAPATNTTPPSGKKANPIDDIGLYPEQ